MKAGFARALITPPRATVMEGWTTRDLEQPAASGVHDDLHASALYVRHEGEEALIMGLDVLFFSREHADRMKGALGRVLDLSPRQILLNASHTHAGPATSNYAHHYDLTPDWAYLNLMEQRLIDAALQARAGARDCTMSAGAARSRLPVSRRKPDGKGGVLWLPHPEGRVCDHLPLCLLRDRGSRPICLLYSVSCHPATVYGWEFSADFPGEARRRIDEHLGAPVSLFLQGMGGDTKASVVGEPRDGGEPRWRRGDWLDVERAGAILASELIEALRGGLTPVEPLVRTALLETHWPLGPLPDRRELESLLTHEVQVRRQTAGRHLRWLDRGIELPTSASILVQGAVLGRGVRIVALEGEPVGDLGRQILDAFAGGVTFPLGYSNGLGLYLVTTRMLREGGYEPESYYEYGYPAPLAEGTEVVLAAAIAELKLRGIG